MKVHLESLIGTGWDQLVSLTIVAGIVASGVIFWLRYRLGKYFVTRPDHLRLMAQLAKEHGDNMTRLVALESQTEQLATKHSLKNIAQQNEALGLRVVAVERLASSIDAKVDGVSKSGDRVEHMMGMVLDHMLDRDKP